MSDVQEEARRQLQTVRRDFEARLPGMIEEIACAWETAKTASDQERTLKALIHLVHSFAGNAGFFGLTEIGRSASKLEETLAPIVGTRLNAENICEIHQFVGALQTAAGACQNTG